MSDTPFIITIDTEGDDLWGRPREITTHNAKHLPRFQSLAWLLNQAARKTRHGALRTRGVFDGKRRLIGWYLQPRAGGRSQ
jgi:hypothetical protein